MNKLIFFIIVLFYFTCKNTIAQYNYVPNPSFEEYDSIPLYLSDSTIHSYYYIPKYWFLPVSCGNMTYFNALLNNVSLFWGVPQNPWTYTYPYDGNAYAAMNLFVIHTSEYRNYHEIQLKDTLKQNKRYCVSFYITLADSSDITIDKIGAYFSCDSVLYYSNNPGPCLLLENPQVKNSPETFFDLPDKWYRIAGSFVASGGEKYLTIGNFNSDQNTNYTWMPDTNNVINPWAYFLLDMVTVMECDTNVIIIDAFAGNKDSICKGDSIMLGQQDTTLSEYEFHWLPESGLNDPWVQNPIASPAQTTTYTLTQTYFGANATYDTVTVSVIDCSSSINTINDNADMQIKLYPNPAKDQLSISYTNTENITDELLFEVYDLPGKKLITNYITANQQLTISTRELGQGIYLYRFVKNNNIVKAGKLVIIK